PAMMNSRDALFICRSFHTFHLRVSGYRYLSMLKYKNRPFRKIRRIIEMMALQKIVIGPLFLVAAAKGF
ncbi:MAG: hypothetical protein II158_00335, partial [Bacilli bacterium]|nr:hypothetical protein [Bacilli bacterium]